MIILFLAILILLSPVVTSAESKGDGEIVRLEQARTAPLTIEEVLARIELTHPLLRATGVERKQARAKILKALGAWEPTVKNITEAARIQIWNFLSYDHVSTGGFNDTKLEVGHPWGFRILGGIRNGFGDRSIVGTPPQSGGTVALIPDIQLFYPQQQMVVGGSIHLLRGLIINEENAEFQKAELMGPLAEVHIAQKRQDLYLAGAIQYWDWQLAVKQAEVRKQNLAVAEARYQQIEGQAKAGKVSPLDVVEMGQEVQRRREAAIAAQRKVEYEQYKLSLFLWENGEPVTPRPEWAPEFQGETPLPTEEEIGAYKAEAKEDRPEVRALYIEAKMNNIDLKLAKNYLLPKFDFEGGRTDAPADWIVGVGYRYATQFAMPLFQREARGKVLYAEAEQQRLVLSQLYTEQQVSLDVDNWLSAIVRARDRVRAATEAYRLAKALEEGERKRFDMGISSILFVNLREQNAVEAAFELYQAQYDYDLARGGLLLARGALSKPVGDTVLAKYGNPLTAAGKNGYKQQGRD
ncbi:MAG: TolC family protein [Nitrospira sp.]|nr:TolC family protein [Nitrospira sp.]